MGTVNERRLTLLTLLTEIREMIYVALVEGFDQLHLDIDLATRYEGPDLSERERCTRPHKMLPRLSLYSEDYEVVPSTDYIRLKDNCSLLRQ
jgi:hypothetical protein